MLRPRPITVLTIARDFKRYVGAQIGIHNPKGERVGTVGKLRNTEYLYLVTGEPVAAERVASGVMSGAA